jgi:outer membrane immunogenic protein
MRTPLLATAALATSLCGGSVQAADFGRPAMAAPPAPAFNWTGFYLGGSVGGRWSDVTWMTSGPFIFDPSTTPASFDSSALRLGGYLGYNWQFSPSWVAGVEGDLAWADSSQTRGGIPGTFGPLGIQTAPPAAAAVDSSTVKEGGDGGVRGRLGFLITPTWLVYATGGVVWQAEDVTAACDGSANSWCIAPHGETVSATRSGWTVGGGVEGQLLGNWLGRAEYRFADFGTASHNFFTGTVDQVAMSHTLKTHTFFVGLAYKF